MAKAEAFAKRALGIAEKSGRTETLEFAHIQGMLGAIACERKQWKKCISACRRSLALKEKLGRDDQSDLAGDLSYIGQALIGLGRAGEAVAPLERSFSLASRPNAAVGLRGLAAFDLARALWNSGRDRKRAARLAKQARAELRELDADGRDDLAEVEAWLAERGIR